jgi:CysZ protein
MRSLLRGAGYLLRGIRTFAATPSVWALGLLPVVIALAVIGTALTLLAVNLDEVAAALTPGADGWSASARDTARFVVGAALLVGGVAVAVLGFATLTNLIGQPFFETLSDRIEQELGEG